MNHILRWADWILFLIGLTIAALGIGYESGMPGFITLTSFPWTLTLPFLTGAIALHAARWFAAGQLAVKMLERFNSEEMYKIRRQAWNEAFLWLAGDRYLLINFMAARPYPNLNLRESDKDKLIAVGRLLEFLAELQAYTVERQLSPRLLRRLMRDRFSWFAPFFLSLQNAIRAQPSYQGKNGLWIPYKTFTERQRDDQRWESAIDWTLRTLRLRKLASYRSPKDSKPAFDELKDGTDWHKNPPSPNVRYRLSGLKRFQDLNEFVVVMDTSDTNRNTLDTEIPHPGSMGFVRLRRKAAAKGNKKHSPDESSESEYMLDVLVDVPMHGYHRYFTYLEHAPKKDDEESIVADLRAIRYWVTRLYYQGIRFIQDEDAISEELQLEFAMRNDERIPSPESPIQPL